MQKQGYIPKEQRKKILFICDDIRLNSGVSTMAREIVIGTSHVYNYCIIGAAINHPDQGKRLDISGDTNNHSGINDASVIVYPNNGYGNPDLLRQLIKVEKPDAVMIFTDPRYFTWLFQIEDEIRKHIPLIYYSIWDSSPTPTWNKSYYESCDLLMCISKQTKNLTEILLEDVAKDKIISYVPHGINQKHFFPITQDYPKYEQFKLFRKNILGGKEYDFVVFWNSRNIHRKHPGDVILSFSQFVSKLPKEKAQKCALIMHTQPVDDNGTDLRAVREALCDSEYCNVIFSEQRLDPTSMNYLYNIADVTMLISSNEGWGLSLTESMMAGTMILANVTGGMADQMGFKDDNGKWMEYNKNFLSNHFGTYKECGDWAIPVFPSNISLAGSVPTPYIFDDRADFRDVANKLMEVYNMSVEERTERGIEGLKWASNDEVGFTADKMCERVIENIDKCFETFKPKSKYTLTKVEALKPKLLKHPIVY